jgi:hypothetical protein
MAVVIWAQVGNVCATEVNVIVGKLQEEEKVVTRESTRRCLTSTWSVDNAKWWIKQQSQLYRTRKPRPAASAATSAGAFRLDAAPVNSGVAGVVALPVGLMMAPVPVLLPVP